MPANFAQRRAGGRSAPEDPQQRRLNYRGLDVDSDRTRIGSQSEAEFPSTCEKRRKEQTNRDVRCVRRRTTAMSDDKSKTGNADRVRINLSEDYEVRDWAKKFGVTEDALRRAAERVDPMAEDVRRELGGQ